MKKMLVLLMMSLFVSSCAVQLDYFINPLFYEELRPISKPLNGWSYHLTPNSAICTHPTFTGDGCEDGDCQLIDQSETKVLFECIKNHPDKIKYPNGQKQRLLFEIIYNPKLCSFPVNHYYYYGSLLSLDHIPIGTDSVRYGVTEPNCISDSMGFRIDNPTTLK